MENWAYMGRVAEYVGGCSGFGLGLGDKGYCLKYIVGTSNKVKFRNSGYYTPYQLWYM